MKTPEDTAMTPAEFNRLDALERRIDTAWDEAARALGEIKDAKLYRRTRDGTKQTWEQYVNRVHGWTPQWANKLIRRAHILQSLNTESESPVSLSPTAVGHLEGLEPQEQAEVLDEATTAGHTPTAKDVGAAKFKKLMDRVKPQKGKKGTDNKAWTGYLVTVVTTDNNNLKKFGDVLPSPITDFNAHSVSGWVKVEQINRTLTDIGGLLAAEQATKIRLVVEL